MKERLYLSEDARAWIEVCDCGGQWQVRLRGEAFATSGAMHARVKLKASDVRRIAEFLASVADEIEAVEPQEWERLRETGEEGK